MVEVDALKPVPLAADPETRAKQYAAILERLQLLLEGETDWVTAMATVASELHAGFEYYNWTGFYRLTRPGMLKLGPYQGATACMSIPTAAGVCGAAARHTATQLVPDVNAFPGHIACASSTQSEVVVPLLWPAPGRGDEPSVAGVLDVDSNAPAAFQQADARGLEAIVAWLMEQPWDARTLP